MKQIMTLPIKKIGLPDELLLVFLDNNIFTLQDALERKSSELLQLNNFGYRHLKMLLAFLEETNLWDNFRG